MNGIIPSFQDVADRWEKAYREEKIRADELFSNSLIQSEQNLKMRSALADAEAHAEALAARADEAERVAQGWKRQVEAALSILKIHAPNTGPLLHDSIFTVITQLQARADALAEALVLLKETVVSLCCYPDWRNAGVYPNHEWTKENQKALYDKLVNAESVLAVHEGKRSNSTDA